MPRWSATSTRYVGEVVAYLKKIGQFDNTFIMFIVRQRRRGQPARSRAALQAITSARNTTTASTISARGNTYVMYGANWASASATPFNRHKASGWEGGIHVPAFVHYPRKVARGSRSDATGTMMDLLPTFLAVAGAQHPGTQFRGREVLPPRGKILLPVFYGQAAAGAYRDEVMGWEQGGPRACAQGDWKMVWDTAGAGRAASLADVRSGEGSFRAE